MRYRRFDRKQWCDIVASGLVVDISHELPDGFLVIYQWMRAKVLLEGKKYFVDGWCPPGGEAYVELILAKK
jgi:hypothetical protein